MTDTNTDNGTHDTHEHHVSGFDAPVDRKAARLASIADERTAFMAERDQLRAQVDELNTKIKYVDAELANLAGEESWIRKQPKPRLTKAQKAAVGAKGKR